MPAEKLTEQYLRLVGAGATRIEISDAISRGLRIRISPERPDGSPGDRAWSFVYRSGAKVERVAIGKYPAMTIAQARLKADELRVARSRGEQPAEDKRAEKVDMWTVDELAETFLDDYASGKKSSAQYTSFLKPFRRKFGHRDPATLRKGELIRWLDEVAVNAPVGANRTQSHINKLFGWATERDLLPGNPLAGIKRRRKEFAKALTLKPAEIAALWRESEPDGGSTTPSAGLALRLVLLTGARPGEVVGMRLTELEDIGSPAPMWRLPGVRVKSGRPRLVPIAPLAAKLIQERLKAMRHNGVDVDHLFPSRLDQGVSASPAFLPQAVVALRGRLPDRPVWTAHDLRRTAATLASEGGSREEDIAALLGHASIGITGRVYNQNQRVPEMRRAVEAIELAVKKCAFCAKIEMS